jgi:hypothetical protein
MRRGFVVLAVSVLGIALGCGSETPSGDPDGGASSGSSGASGASGGSSGFGTTDGGYSAGDGSPGSCTPLKAADGSTPQCADCIDNDGDGFVDSGDPECAGPLDNDEKTFGTGIPGDNVDACKQDCFFDGNSGQGDDRCEWNLKCDPANPGGASCPYDPGFKNCPATQSAQCKQFCAKVTPNGCDCFGCCNIPLPGGGSKNVVLSSTCSIADINDPAKCRTCTPNTDCSNPCDRCELCIGKPSVPADCAPAGGSDAGTPSGQVCTGGITCNAALPCASGTYCVTGCCIPIIR